jgi:hypothetical protein
MPKGIIEAAEQGRLVLFCGAGISTENKTVLPHSLYTEVQEQLGEIDYAISFSKLMQRYCNEPNGRRKLLQLIKKRFEYIHSFPELERQATAFHNELAELYFIKTIITTNWDTYFETYCGATPITIPEDLAFWDDYERYVLKIHGSINNLSTIVATSDDYAKCLENFRDGSIGAKLKDILATKTVVFIGYSFGDENFSQIIDFLREEQRDIFPHIYVVTIDDTLEEKLSFKNATFIVTAGTHFLHRLKQSMQENGKLVNSGISPFVCEALDIARNIHAKVSKISLQQHPSAIYTLSYQDGVKHAFERFIQMNKSGEYCIPGRVCDMTVSYASIVDKNRKIGNYWDMAYFEGYLNALIYIESCGNNPMIINEFPFLYLPNAKCVLSSYEIFVQELERVSQKRGKYSSYAISIVKKHATADLVVHHPPY